MDFSKKIINRANPATIIVLFRGAPHSFIGDSLGHINYRTTENYLAYSDDKQLVEFAGLLLPRSKSK